MGKDQPDYLSYLLRLWRVNDGEKAVWRASLESPHTAKRRGFGDLEDLFTFLEKEIGQGAQDQTALGAEEKGGDAHE
jgi:hypothetical protein